MLPLEGIEAAVRAHVPQEVTVTVTASPRRGLGATLELSERSAREGYAVVPHLSARLVRDAAHLEEVLARLQAALCQRARAGLSPAPGGSARSAGAVPALPAAAAARAP